MTAANPPRPSLVSQARELASRWRIERIPAPAFLWTITALAASVVVALVVLSNRYLTPQDLDQAAKADYILAFPGGVVGLMLLGMGIAAGAATLAVTMERTWFGAGMWALVHGAGIFPAASLFAEAREFPGWIVPAVVGLAAWSTATAVGVGRAVRGDSPRPGSVLASLCSLIPWLLACFTPGLVTSLASTTLASHLIYLSPFVFAIAVFVAFVDAAESRQRRMRILGRTEVSVGWVWLALVVVVAVLVLRLTLLRNLFGEVDAVLWDVWKPAAWPLTLVVAWLVVRAVNASFSAPVLPRGMTAVTGAAMLGSTALLLGPAIALSGAYLAGAFTGATVDAEVGGSMAQVILALSAVGVLTALAVSRARTIGQVAGRVSLVYLAPLYAPFYFPAAFTSIPHFWATAVGVTVAIVGIVAVLLVVQASSGRALLHPAAALRLIVVPVLVVHAGVLLPAAWTSGLGPALVVLFALGALLVDMPARGGDPLRQGAGVLNAVWPALAALVVFFAAGVSAYTDTDYAAGVVVTFASIPIALGLMLRARPAEG